MPVTRSAGHGALTVSGLAKSFGGRRVLHGLDLDVPTGGSVAVVGPSGCGKTTLLRILAGFDRPDAGTVRLGGRELTGAGRPVPAHHRRIGYVPQDGALFPHLTVGGNVGFGLARRERTRDRIDGLLERVSLDPEMARLRPDQLSGGQQQRVALARALAQSPRAVLLDESFSALDAGLRGEIRSAVAGILRAGGVTALLVTHDHEEALSFADRVAVMRDGRFVQVDSPREVYLRPSDDATAEFFGEVVRLAGDARDGLVQTDLGPVRLAGAAVDGPVSLTVRTEQVVLGAAGAVGARGVVREARFLGSAVRCEVTVDGLVEGARTVVARCRPQDAPEVDDEVRVSVVGEGRCTRIDHPPVAAAGEFSKGRFP
ncbi:ABC transporter ATP-binding protein [Rhodococcus sp. IEGM 1408]|uniref:ABC transporter ATP-binding protein n=1 Tax=Rhodococcus sp. IEGM 1408 TaxID=3082220 RepID=UPI002953F3D3|nr:ABC transporter ATP-binding protein [Rhodococcus sp. IEGM 1408]MDV8001702.1 ABC transporter ATP-binding protein [Rhodococcus sp. IEGM 1408]